VRRLDRATLYEHAAEAAAEAAVEEEAVEEEAAAAEEAAVEAAEARGWPWLAWRVRRRGGEPL